MPSNRILKRVLLLSANPRGTEPLQLHAEERSIKEQLRLAGFADPPIFSSGATRPRDLQQALLDTRPQIVHFSGHGGTDGLALEDESGKIQMVGSRAIGELLRILAAVYPIECVIINARLSGFASEDLLPHVGYVVEISTDIADDAALEFVIGFYRALAAGQSYEFAYELGCNAIELAGLRGSDLPVLRSNVSAAPPIGRSELAAESSVTAVQWSKLVRFLEEGWWKEADLLTNALMLQVVGRDEGDWMRDVELEGFPCASLLRFDELWLEHSKGRFGFSVQQAIWKSLGGLGLHPKPDNDMERAFGDRVGWRRGEVWLGYHDYTFGLSAEPGHLPRFLYNHASGWWLGRSCLICTRLEGCQGSSALASD